MNLARRPVFWVVRRIAHSVAGSSRPSRGNAPASRPAACPG